MDKTKRRIDKKNWANEKRTYAQKFLGITGKDIKIRDIDKNTGEIGYTDNKSIHLAYEHPIYEGLSEGEASVVRKGVFTHEMLHCIFTDFNVLQKTIMKYPVTERKILAGINNVLEDPAIENFAPQIIGGSLLRSLRLMIAHVYKKSTDIDKQEYPFGQFMNALIQFGDMGLIKGHFTSKEAYDVFAKVAPILDKAISEPNPITRMKYSEEIFELSRVLWQEEADINQMILDIMQELESQGKGSSSSSAPSGMLSTPEDTSENTDEDSDKKKKRRNITIRKVSKEELEEMRENDELSESGDELPEGDIELLVCDEDDDDKNDDSSNTVPVSEDNNKLNNDTDEDPSGKSNKSNENSNDSNDSDDSDGSNGSDDSDDSDDADDSDGSNGSDDSDDADDSDGSNGSDDSDDSEDSDDSDDFEKSSKISSNSDTKIDYSNNKESATNDDDYYETIEEDEYFITEEDIETIEREIEDMQREANTENSKNDDSNIIIDDFDITSPIAKSVNCINTKTTIRDQTLFEAPYDRAISGLQYGIRTLTKDFKRILRQDRVTKRPHTSGRINLDRYGRKKASIRIFDKKQDPGKIDDLAVFIAVDESGSMHGDNVNAARQTCIALAEVFENLDIPIYIMGFTAEMYSNKDVQHYHYINWNNSKYNRMKLLNISARSTNYDGYAIRYASEVLKKYKSTHKLLIVISDGQPNFAPLGPVGSLNDTKLAIKEAKKHSSILGVAIGNTDTEIIRHMYEKDFLHISNVDELFTGITKQIQEILKTWR